MGYLLGKFLPMTGSNYKRTILITGINGYLGSNLAKHLSHDFQILGLENAFSNLGRIKNENYQVWRVEDKIPHEPFRKFRVELVIHTATFYGKSESSPQVFQANLFFPFEILDLSINNGCKLFINTDTVLERFTNTYALSKRQFREWCYMRRNDIKVINMQLEHFYGPGASASNFITSMIDKLKSNKSEIELTAGEQQRDFVYIDDVVRAFKCVIEQQKNILDNYTSFQVCSGELWTIKDLMLELKKLTRSTSLLKFGVISYRNNELMKSETNNAMLLNLGWKPAFSMKEGLLKTINSLSK